jgi:hypothetical protein
VSPLLSIVVTVLIAELFVVQPVTSVCELISYDETNITSSVISIRRFVVLLSRYLIASHRVIVAELFVVEVCRFSFARFASCGAEICGSMTEEFAPAVWFL